MKALDIEAVAELPIVLKRMNGMEPSLVVEMRVAASRDVLDDFDRGALDAAIVLRHDDRRRDGEVILEEGFGWMAAPDFERRPGERLRLLIYFGYPAARAGARARVVPISELVFGTLTQNRSSLEPSLGFAAMHCGSCTIGTQCYSVPPSIRKINSKGTAVLNARRAGNRGKSKRRLKTTPVLG
jgi:DNA-binding transcriptional LysR family regulator